ncbi:6408_t:CDS:1, partial [Racocetra fulgida]
IANKIIALLVALQLKKQENEINRLGQITKYQNTEMEVNNLNKVDLQLPKNFEKRALEKLYKLGL